MARTDGIYDKGKSYEFLLLQEMSKLGYWCMRAPRSGGGYLPDLVCIRRKRSVMFEVKSLASVRDVYLPVERVIKLLLVRNRVDCEIYLAVFFEDKGRFYIVPMDSYDYCTGSYYVFKARRLLSLGRSTAEVFG